MTITPSGARKPASRDFLLPEFRQAIPGNRVQMFLRCFMEQDIFFGKVESEKRHKWIEMALKDLPVNELKNYGGQWIRRDMHDAARMTNADWQLWYFARRDGYNTLLPDVQKMRALAEAIKSRVRGEIANRDFEGALHDLRTLLGLARSMESHPTLIGNLVGFAITEIAVKAIQELVQQPGAPNLYWALTDLPSPFMSIRAGLEGERMFISADFEELRNSADPISDSAVMRKIEYIEKLFAMEGPGNKKLFDAAGTPKKALPARAKIKQEVAAARERLIQSGLKPEHVRVWTPLHVVLLDEARLYEEYRDEACKWANLPYWKARPGMAAEEAKLKKESEKSPFLVLVPAIAKVKTAQARTDQRLRAILHIEAIRLYAHEHQNKLPAKLDDIKLPLGIDPVTGKPFEYSVKDGVATLHGANPHPDSPQTNKYYEIRVSNK